MAKILFFAYGEHISLSTMTSTPVEFVDRGKAKLKNAQLCFKGSFIGVPTIEKVKGKVVIGRLYEIDEKDFGVSKLKITEGYLQSKMRVKVITPSGKIVRAYSFIVRDIINGQVNYQYNYITAKRRLYRTMLKGYKELGINPKRLQKAAVYSMLKCYERDWYSGEAGDEY